MALTSVNRVVTSHPGSAERAAIVLHNNVLTQHRVDCAKRDADAGVTDTNYADVLDTASLAGAYIIKDQYGNTITE